MHRGIDREITIAYLQLGLFGMLVLLAAWFGGEQLIMRPIRVADAPPRASAAGDLRCSRDVAFRFGGGVRPSAAALHDMARKLAGREEELQIANQHLEELASLDGLTGLANRRGFDRQLDRRVGRAADRQEPLALMMIDIDHFKLFNDRYGHVRGDACLRAVGETLSLVTPGGCHPRRPLRRRGIRPAAPRPRHPRGRPSLPTRPAARSRTCSSPTPNPRSAAMSPSASASNRSCRRPAKPAADLVEAADRALYAAKRRGRNTVIAHVPMVMSAA